MTTLLLISLLLPLVSASTIQTSVGQSVRLSCPMADTASSCETRECTWTGPGGLHVSAPGHESLHVDYDRDTCECVLSIRVTSLSHAGVWRWASKHMSEMRLTLRWNQIGYK